MYRSPIDMFVTDIQHQIEKQEDEEIYKAVASVGINVDKEELIRALRYDRQQYEKGFLDGQAAAGSAMIRCGVCQCHEPCEVKGKVWCKKMNRYMKEDGFCSEGGKIMTLKEFAQMLDGREYGHEITKEEEILAKELGFVVVFGYSDDNAELRGAINDEIGCFDGGVLEHEDLPATIYADWCPEDIDCSWAYGTSIPHEKFYIFEDGSLYCVGIVCDISKPKPTNADRIRMMSDEELAQRLLQFNTLEGSVPFCRNLSECDELLDTEDGIPEEKCKQCLLNWLRQPAEVE